MKHSGVLTFAIVAALCLATCYGINFAHGSIESGNKLLYQEKVEVPAKPNKLVSKIVTYPPVGAKNIDPSKIITAVFANDLSKGKNYGTGFVAITRGGPKHSNVELEIKSFRGMSLNYSVEIWGV